MTNIGAITIEEKKGKKTSESLIFVADSQGTNFTDSFKEDNSQKLFRVQDYLLMGTGSHSNIAEVVKQLSKEKIPSTKEVALKVLGISDKFGLSENDYLNFIVGGKDDKILNLYHINTTGNFKAFDGTADYKKRRFTRSDHYFDGAASDSIGDYIRGARDVGKPLFREDLVDGILLLYNFGKKCAKHISVNDRLQFGIISSEGVSTLYPPDTDLLDYEAYKAYVGKMLNIEVPEIKLKTPFKERERIVQKNKDIGSLLKSVYITLNGDLSHLSNCELNYTSYSENWARGKVTLRELRARRNELLEAKKNVAFGVNALVKKGADNLISYKRDSDRRQKEIENRILKEYKK